VDFYLQHQSFSKLPADFVSLNILLFSTPPTSPKSEASG